MPVFVSSMPEDEIMLADFAALLEEIGAFVLQMEGYPSESEISIVLVNNDYIRELNFTYRGLDSPTDVLSFPLHDAEEEGDNILGDVVISLEKAQEQALNYGHSLRREVAFLAAHGILHLVGYDHMDEAAEKEMEAKQEYVMERFDCRR